MYSQLLVLVACLGWSQALSVQMTVNQRSTECLYEQLNEGYELKSHDALLALCSSPSLFLHRESATISLFILSGPELKATAQFAGPVAPSDIDSGTALEQLAQKFDEKPKKKRGKAIDFSQVVNFEHLNKMSAEDEDEEEEEEVPEDESAEDRRARLARQRKKALEARQRREKEKVDQRKRVRETGEPFQKTFKAPANGWYRYCVVASWHQVVAEIDLRKESELGGIAPHGHVLTFEEKAMKEEDQLMEEDSAAKEGITDEDFLGTREKLKSLRRLLADIQSKQQQERHRLIVHAATNEHSHSRMVMSSLFETILFMAITGFQVYTIRRWFKGAPVLGR